MGALSYTLLMTKQLIINQLDRDKGKGASGAEEAPVRWRRTRAIRSRRRPSPYTFLTTTLHHQSLPHHFQPGPKHSPRHSRPDRESLPRLPAPAILSHHYPTSPNCRTSAPAWWPCLAYRGAPQAEIGPRRTATISTTHRMAPPVRLFGGAPRRFLHSLPLGRNDKGRRSFERT